MKAAVVHGLNDIRIDEVPMPEIGPAQVLVRVGAAGVCSTDVKTLAGLSPPRTVPAILGHEVAGLIVETGTDVEDWQVGQRVAVYPIAACGGCFYCMAGRHSLCLREYGLGRGADGAFAEYLAVPSEVLSLGGLVDIGDTPYATATLIEPLSCVLAAARQCRTGEGSSVVVVGCGPMGLLHVYANRRLGAKVVAVDMNAERLEHARRLGAQAALNPDRDSVREGVLAATEGLGADIVIAAVGFVDAVCQSFDYVRPGGILNVFGGTPRGDMMTVDPRWLHYGEITLTGTFASSVQDFRDAWTRLQEDPEPVNSIVSHHCRLDDIVTAVDRVRTGRGTKTIVVFDEASDDAPSSPP